MDILNLIEILKPVDHVVTVKLDTPTDAWDKFRDNIVVIMPSIIAFATLIYSKKQFDKSFRQQQQFTYLNAKIATRVELIKQKKNTVRSECAEFLSLGNEFSSNRGLSMKMTSLKIDKSAKEEQSLLVLNIANKYLSHKIALTTLLTIEEDKEFLEAIEEYHSHLTNFSHGQEVGERDFSKVQVSVLKKCSAFLEKCDREIDLIVDDYTVQ